MACDGTGSIFRDGGLEPCRECHGAGCGRPDPTVKVEVGALAVTGPASVVNPTTLQSRLKFSTKREDVQANAREIDAEIARLEAELAGAQQFRVANRALCAHDGGVLLCPVCGRSA